MQCDIEPAVPFKEFNAHIMNQVWKGWKSKVSKWRVTVISSSLHSSNFPTQRQAALAVVTGTTRLKRLTLKNPPILLGCDCRWQFYKSRSWWWGVGGWSSKCPQTFVVVLNVPNEGRFFFHWVAHRVDMSVFYSAWSFIRNWKVSIAFWPPTIQASTTQKHNRTKKWQKQLV